MLNLILHLSFAGVCFSFPGAICNTLMKLCRILPSSEYAKSHVDLRIRKSSVRAIVLLLLASFSVWNCGVTYPLTFAQVQNDETLSRRVINKKIELHKHNDETIIGYLTNVEKDSMVISLKKNSQAPQKVAKTEIRYFYVLDTSGKAELMAVLTLTVLLVLLLAAKGLTGGLSHAY